MAPRGEAEEQHKGCRGQTDVAPPDPSLPAAGEKLTCPLSLQVVTRLGQQQTRQFSRLARGKAFERGIKELLEAPRLRAGSMTRDQRGPAATCVNLPRLRHVTSAREKFWRCSLARKELLLRPSSSIYPHRERGLKGQPQLLPSSLSSSLAWWTPPRHPAEPASARCHVPAGR